MSALRSAIAATLARDAGRPVDKWHQENADAVLAMSEMEAIRKALRFASCTKAGGELQAWEPTLRQLGVPESVIEWVER